jgi:hypothetical protein
MIARTIDGWMYGFGDSSALVLVIAASWTAVAAVVLGWLLRGLPPVLQPIGQGGA